VCRIGIVMSLSQQVGTGFSLRKTRRRHARLDRQPIQFIACLCGLSRQRVGVVNTAPGLRGLVVIANLQVGPAERCFDIGARGIPVFFQRPHRIPTAGGGRQGLTIQQRSVTQENGFGIFRVEIVQGQDHCARVAGSRIGGRKVIIHILAQITRAWLRAL